ncbi:MAG: carbonic anhydrase [Peptococcaceae bacterium BICA1-7]|nr:MAG: carbonic anhydrase [Peptococcaceae bacterium BICA1-7]HBV96947.1 gamma carbonic anhydrase family protein [Desulfotomaculum sp.]
MRIIEFQGKKPRIAEGAFIAPTAVLIGDVTVGEGSSVWYGAVLRGDFGSIIIGKNSSIQDNVVMHMTPGGETRVGDNVTIAHGAVLHTAAVGDGAVVGMNAVLLDNCVVGEQCMIAAGSVVSTGTSIPPRHLAAGAPAVPKKEISGEALNWVTASAMAYSHLSRSYIDQGLDKE